MLRRFISSSANPPGHPTMNHRSRCAAAALLSCLLTVIAATSHETDTATAQEPVPKDAKKSLELIPQDASFAIVVRSVDDLVARMSELQKQEDLPNNFLGIVNLVAMQLKSKQELDGRLPVALVGLESERNENVAIDDMFLAMPIKPGQDVNDRVIQRLIAPFPAPGAGFLEHEPHIVVAVGPRGRLARFKIENNVLQQLMSAELATPLNKMDVLGYANLQHLDNSVRSELDQARKEIQRWPEVRLRALGLRMAEDFYNVQHLFFAVDLANGLDVNFSALFQNPDGSPPFLFQRLKKSPAKFPPHYRGLPNAPTLGALAIGDAATRNAEVLTVLDRLGAVNLDSLLVDVFGKSGVDDRPGVVEFMTRIAAESTGARAAFYANDTAVVVIDSAAPERVVAALRQIIAEDRIAQRLEYVEQHTMVGDVPVDLLRLRSRERSDEGGSPPPGKLVQLLDRGLYIAKLEEHVVVSAEAETIRLAKTIDNIRSDAMGLAERLGASETPDGQIHVIDIRFYADKILSQMIGNTGAKKPAKIEQAENGMTTARLLATTKELTIAVSVPKPALRRAIREAFPE